jgi:FACT complex subunit SPT16 N-terminal lobe domain
VSVLLLKFIDNKVSSSACTALLLPYLSRTVEDPRPSLSHHLFPFAKPRSEGIWGGADCLLFHKATTSEDYLKSSILHQWLFRYELPDTILLIRKDGAVYFCASKKKCEFLQGAVDNTPNSGSTTIKEIHLLVRNKEDGDAENYEKLWNEAMVSRVNGETRKLGVFVKERKGNVSTKGSSLLSPWEERLETEMGNNVVELVDVAPGVSFAMSIKDEGELDLMKKSSVLSNKVMKHGCVKKLENIMDSEDTITNEELAEYIDSVLEGELGYTFFVPPLFSHSFCYCILHQTHPKLRSIFPKETPPRATHRLSNPAAITTYAFRSSRLTPSCPMI